MIQRIVRCLLLLAVVVTPALAQESRGTLSGRITDPSGAAIPDVQVQITNVQTGVVLAVQTNSSGEFTAPFLLPSVYKVSASHPGFKQIDRENVEVQVGDKVQLDLVLPLGDVAQSVEVSGATPLLSTGAASLGTVVATRQIQGLPMASGNVAELAVLSQAFPAGHRSRSTRPLIMPARRRSSPTAIRSTRMNGR